jgi:spore maturation protein CgeB
MAEAGRLLGLQSRLLSWDPATIAAAESFKAGAEAAELKKLFKACAERTAEEAARLDPALVLVLAQAPLDLHGVELLRRMAPSSPAAFWFVEDFRRFGYVADVAPAFDLFLHIQGPLMDSNLKRWGVSKAWYLPLAADAFVNRPIADVPRRFRAAVSFMGAGYPNRRAILSDFAVGWRRSGRDPADFKIFGSGWDSPPLSLAPHLFEGGRRTTSAECAEIYAGAAVSLNVHSGEGTDFDRLGAFVNPRTFEAAAAGSPQAVDRRELLAELFDDEELTIVDRPEDLLPATLELLEGPQEARRQAEAARARVLREHLYVHRLRFILERVGVDVVVENDSFLTTPPLSSNGKTTRD